MHAGRPPSPSAHVCLAPTRRLMWVSMDRCTGSSTAHVAYVAEPRATSITFNSRYAVDLKLSEKCSLRHAVTKAAAFPRSPPWCLRKKNRPTGKALSHLNKKLSRVRDDEINEGRSDYEASHRLSNCFLPDTYVKIYWNFWNYFCVRVLQKFQDIIHNLESRF